MANYWLQALTFIRQCTEVSWCVLKFDSKHYTSVIWLHSFSHGPSASISTTENGHILDCSHKTGRRVFPKTAGTAASTSLWWCLLVRCHKFNLVSGPLTCIAWLQCLGVFPDSWLLAWFLTFILNLDSWYVSDCWLFIWLEPFWLVPSAAPTCDS